MKSIFCDPYDFETAYDLKSIELHWFVKSSLPVFLMHGKIIMLCRILVDFA